MSQHRVAVIVTTAAVGVCAVAAWLALQRSTDGKSQHSENLGRSAAAVRAIEVVREDGVYGAVAFPVTGGWVTARHVLEGAASAVVLGHESSRIAIVSILADDPTHDIVMFGVDSAEARGHTLLRLAAAPSSGLKSGDALQIIGPPSEVDRVVDVTLERIQAIEPYGLMFVLTFAGEAGWSGCPVISDSGEVVAVVREIRGDGLYASPISELLAGDPPLEPISLQEWTQSPAPQAVLARAAFREAAGFEREGEVEAALEAYARAIRIEPKYAWARARRAVLLEQTGESDAAALELEKAAETAPTDPEVQFRRFMLAVSRRDPTVVKDSGNRLMTLRPDDVQFPAIFARALLRVGEVSDAVHLLRERAVESTGFVLLAEGLMRLDDYAAALDVLMHQDVPGPRADRLLLISSILTDKEQAGETVERTLRPPAAANFWMAREVAREVVVLGAHEPMIERLRELVVDQTGLSESGHLLGCIYLMTGDPARARESFSAALEHDPRYWLPLAELVLLDVGKGDHEKALAGAERLVEVSRGDPEARYILAMRFLKADRLDEAEAQARAILAQDDRESRAWEVLGFLAFERDSVQQAIEYYLRATDLRPQDTRLRKDLVAVLRASGELARARLEIEKVTAGDPSDFDALLVLGEVLIQMQMRDAAAAVLVPGAKRAPDDGALLDRLLRALCAVGEHDSAAGVLSRLRDLDPAYPESLQDGTGCP